MRLLAAYREAYAGIPRPAWLLALVLLVNRAGTMVLPFLALYLTGPRGFTPRAAGLVLVAYGLGSMTGAWAGGSATDRWGAIRVQVVSLAATGALFLVLARLASLTAIATAAFLLAVAADAYRPASSVAFVERVPTAVRPRAFALARLAVNAGMTVGPAVGGVLARRDYAWLFRVDAATCFAAALLLLALFGAGRRDEPVPHPPDAATPAPSPWSDRPFLVFLLLTTLWASILFQWFSAYPLTLRDHFALAEDRIGFAFAANTLLIVACEMVLIHRLAGRDALAANALGALAIGLGFGALPFGSGYAWVLAGVAVWTLGEMLTMPLAEAWVAERAAPASRGRYLGAYVATYSLAFTAGPAAGNWVYQRWGPRVLWPACAALAAATAAGLFALSRRTRDARHSPTSS